MSARKTLQVGFVIDGKLPSWSRPWQLLLGSPSHSAVGEMRFGWIADHLNAAPAREVHYSLYQPWRRYDAVIFMKSMGAAHQTLAQSLRQRGTRVVFDVNVDYFSETHGTFYYKGMAPTSQQIQDAHRMAELSDALIADSSHLATVCAQHHPQVQWISDNVDLRLAPPWRPWKPGPKLDLLWSGESVKLFELLSIEELLRKFANRVRLVLVTNSLAALDRWFDPWKSRFEGLLQAVEHEIIPFRSIGALLETYSRGGVFISPRFLDNSYNHGHTEWKITLPMACGRAVLGSPLPSYKDVADRSHGAGLRLCSDAGAWESALEDVLSGKIDFAAEEGAAQVVVKEHYSTPVVAKAHRDYLAHVCSDAPR
jgi:hypothetical protein